MAMTDINKMIKSNAPHTSGGDFADVLGRIEAMRSAPQPETFVEDFAVLNEKKGMGRAAKGIAKAVAVIAAVVVGAGVIVGGLGAIGIFSVSQESDVSAAEDVCMSESSSEVLWEDGEDSLVSESDVPSDSDLWDIEEEGMTE